MNQTLRKVVIIINTLAFVGGLIWTYFDFDFEPIVTSLVLFATLIGLVITKSKNEDSVEGKKNRQKVNTEINITNNVNNEVNQRIPKSSGSSREDIDKRKALTHVLFVDDDSKFKIIKILNRAGWQTKIVKDIDNLDADIVLKANILFVDINGVGIKLEFKDEGLGLAHALKKKYPHKRVIIYSTDSTGDRFHEALRTVDTFLSKNAEPFEFQELIEQYSAEIELS